jgi:hypothetical protein
MRADHERRAYPTPLPWEVTRDGYYVDWLDSVRSEGPMALRDAERLRNEDRYTRRLHWRP